MIEIFSVKNESMSNQVLDWAREYFNSTRFLFTDPASQVRIIKGWEEGVFGFIALNYLYKHFSLVKFKQFNHLNAGKNIFL